MQSRVALLPGAVFLLCFTAALSAADSNFDTELAKARKASGDEAIALYKALAATHPDSGVVHYETGLVLMEKLEWLSALDEFEHALKLEYKPAKSLRYKGKCQAKLKQFAAAEESYRRALELEPESPAAKFGLATSLFNQNKSADALSIFEKLAARDDEWGETAGEYLGQCYFDLGNYDDALVQARKANARKADSASNWFLARCLFKLRNFRDALPLFQKAILDVNHSDAAKYYAAVCLTNLGQHGPAKDYYGELKNADNVWGHEARAALEQRKDNPWRTYLEYSAGYDTNIIVPDFSGSSTGKKDGFNQIYADVAGRAYQNDELSLWLEAQHYGLYYFEVTSQSYFQDSASVALQFFNVSPLKEVAIGYKLNYAQLGNEPYRRENRFELGTAWWDSTSRAALNMFFGENKYFGQFQDVGGPETGAVFEYWRKLPDRDHSIRIRSGIEYRFSDLNGLKRLTQLDGVMYRSKIYEKLFGQVEAQYRLSDYPLSAVNGLSARVDQRFGVEVQLDMQIKRHLSVNLGYLYEQQHSTRPEQRLNRQQATAGFSLSF